MKQPVIIILLGILLCHSICSCVKETSRGDAFEASFTLDTGTVYDGDEFAFTVKTNRSQFKVVSFDFPLAPGLLAPNTTCIAKDGVWTLREKVSVPSSQRGRVSLSIQDPETGLVKDFSAVYSAYASTGLSLMIENEAVSSKYLTAGLPTVVSGDDFAFSLRSKADRLILKEYDFEFNDGTLAVGKEFRFKDKSFSVRIPNIQAQDSFTPRTLSLSLLNPDTGRDTTLTARYVTAARFTPGVTLVNPTLGEGETARLRLTSNRPLFHLKGYTGPSWFVLKDYYPGSPEVQLNLDGYAFFETEPLAIDRSGSGTLNFELYDSDYTHRSVIVSVPYTATVKPAPANVTVSTTDLKLNGGSTELVSVSTTTEGSTNLFTAKVVSSDAAVGLYAPSGGETVDMDNLEPERFTQECLVTDGRLYIRAEEGKWGAATVRVSAKGNEKVYKDIKVYVRRDVALRLKGAFKDDINYYPDAIDEMFSDLNRDEGIGWYGMPQSVEAELVAYENRSTRDLTDLRKDEVSTWVKCFSLGDGNAARFEVSFVVTVGSRVTSRFFYGSYAGYPEPKSRLLTGTDIDRTVNATRPSSINTVISETGVNGSRISCLKLKKTLQELDCCADYQNGYGLFVMLRETLHSDDHLGFGSFDISLSKVTYDRDKYNLRWVMTMFEVPGEWGEAAPWWNKVGGERPWIIPYSE